MTKNDLIHDRQVASEPTSQACRHWRAQVHTRTKQQGIQSPSGSPSQAWRWHTWGRAAPPCPALRHAPARQRGSFLRQRVGGGTDRRPPPPPAPGADAPPAPPPREATGGSRRRTAPQLSPPSSVAPGRSRFGECAAGTIMGVGGEMCRRNRTKRKSTTGKTNITNLLCCAITRHFVSMLQKRRLFLMPRSFSKPST